MIIGYCRVSTKGQLEGRAMRPREVEHKIKNN